MFEKTTKHIARDRKGTKQKKRRGQRKDGKGQKMPQEDKQTKTTEEFDQEKERQTTGQKRT